LQETQMTLAKTALLAIALPLMAGAASAASLSLTGAGYSAGTIGGTGAAFDLVNPTYNGLTGGVGDIGDALSILSGTVKDGTNGLSVSGPARVTFTYLGSEAGFSNSSVNLLTAATIFANQGVSAVGDIVNAVLPAGLLAFSYNSGNGSGIANNGVAVSPNLADIGIAFSALFNGNRSVLVFFDDNGAGPDRDFDDLAMRIDVAPVPVPAAGLMLVAALGGLGAVARRKRALA
jgi:hypothetical protein